MKNFSNTIVNRNRSSAVPQQLRHRKNLRTNINSLPAELKIVGIQ